MFNIDDCLSILDGHLQQLTTFIVQIDHINKSSLISRNMDELYHLKYFLLTSYGYTYHYNDLVVPLLCRMTHLEKLTLCLCDRNRRTFIDGRHLHNEILVRMPQLHTFIFYISTENNINGSVHRISNDDIQQTFTNIRCAQTACHVNYLNTFKAICHVFSLPFTFTRLKMIANQCPTIVFDYVTHLHVLDVIPMKHEFFMRISQGFPTLTCFSIGNIMIQSRNVNELRYDNNSTCSIIEYSHLRSLDTMHVRTDYIAQFLLETKAYVPRLSKLKGNYGQLKTVTMNFTRATTRHNCWKAKRLIVERCFQKMFIDIFLHSKLNSVLIA